MANPWKLKQEMCEIGRRLYEHGMVVATDGNVSARLDNDRVLCTPTGHCKGMLKPEDLCTIDLSGKQRSGSKKATSEVLLHLAVYKEREDVQAVVHAHPPHVTAFAITRTPIPKCVLPEVEILLGPVPTADYATPGTREFADTIIPHIHQANIIVLANHGTISYGKTLEEAYQRTELLDAYCRILIYSRLLGPVKGFSDAEARALLDIKQRLGIDDPRLHCANCDLCGNNVLGRGLPPGVVEAARLQQAEGQAAAGGGNGRPGTEPTGQRTTATGPATTVTQPSPELIEALVQQITNRIMAAVGADCG